MNIADGEDAVGRSLFGCRLGATDFVETAFLIRTYGEIIACCGLEACESDHMHIAFVRHIPACIGFNLPVQIVRVSAVINQSLGGFRLFGHLPEDFDGVGGRRHRIRLLVRDIRIVGTVVILRRDAPSRVSERALIRSCAYRRTILV